MVGISDIERRISAIENRRSQLIVNHFTFNNLRTEIYAEPQKKVYVPSKTGELFHASDDFVRLIMGPYGSGKTTICLQEIVRRACHMPFWDRGQRTSRWAIVRNTSGELESTTLKSWLSWFAELGTIERRLKPILTYKHQFNDGKGLVNLELIFIALDREEDLRKIKSFEITGCYLNELSEIPQGALTHFKGRLNGRYPSKSFCPDPYWSGIIADTNPPDIDHWIYRLFELERPEGYRLFKQPSGLLKDDTNNWIVNRNADNIDNLGNSYYLNQAHGATEEYIKVYCCGEYGLVHNGKLVYPNYNPDYHERDDLEADQGEPIHLGWDFGLTPACVAVQFTKYGQLKVLKEYTAEDIGIHTFVESIVLPGLQRDFPYCNIGLSRADPSGLKRDEIMEELSCIGTLNSLGIPTQGATTNHVETRLNAVRFFLTRNLDRKPAFILSRKNCPILRRGFLKDYIFKRVAVSGEERYKDAPHKNDVSHPHDGLQYIALEFAGATIANDKNPPPKGSFYNPGFRWQ